MVYKAEGQRRTPSVNKLHKCALDDRIWRYFQIPYYIESAYDLRETLNKPTICAS